MAPLSVPSLPLIAKANAEILSIQYLRGIAAMMVVWHHATNQVAGMAEWVPWQFGTSGVDLFFVISGFIMVVTTQGASTSPMIFWRKRIVRVVPLYWLLTLAMVGLALAVPAAFKTLKVAPETLLQSLLFIPHFSQSFPANVWPLLVPGWTLNFEMFFYALFGAMLFLPRAKRLAFLSALLMALVASGALLGPFGSAAAQTYTHPMLLEFLLGAWIGEARRRGAVPFSMAVSTAMVVAGTAMLVFRDTPPLGPLTQIAGAAFVVTGALNGTFSARRWRALHAIGDSSYSLYLTHLFSLGILRLAWVREFSDAPNGWQVAGFMTVAVSFCAWVGWLVYRWIEAPLVGRLNAAMAGDQAAFRMSR